MLVSHFNSLSPRAAGAVVAVWAGIEHWVNDVVAARPFGSVDEVAQFVARSAGGWTAADLDSAMSHHPRIGQRVTGTGAHSQASRAEQSSVDAADAEVVAALAIANADYQKRFGRVFLIRAAGRSADEMLAQARRRLTNDDAAEVREALAQLCEIAQLRLRSDLTDDDQPGAAQRGDAR